MAKVVTTVPEGIVLSEAMNPGKRRSLMKMIQEEFDIYFRNNAIDDYARQYVEEYLGYIKDDGYIYEFDWDESEAFAPKVKLHADDSDFVKFSVIA